MDEIHRQISQGPALVQTVEVAGIGELAEVGGLDAHFGSQGHERFEPGRRHRQGHPLLGLGNQNLPGL